MIDINKPNLTALQLVGSPTSQFFFDLSLLYAKDVVQPTQFELLFVIAYPDGTWSVNPSLAYSAEKMSLQQMIKKVEHADLAVPHMFCQEGLTNIRIFFEHLLKIPLVGSSGYTLQNAQNKQLTKLIVKDTGVRIASGKMINKEQVDEILVTPFKFPLIVKPNCTDNSEGLTLVKEKKDFKPALLEAFQYDQNVLIEAYIPGRELRGAIINDGNSFSILPFIEYGVNSEQPIRTVNDKLKFNKEGTLIAQSDKINVPSHCPALIDDALFSELSDMMIDSHKALGCRDFSMYDFRIDEKSKKPYLLEAGLFWSFSPTSMISYMLKHKNIDLIHITNEIWMNAVKRGKTKI